MQDAGRHAWTDLVAQQAFGCFAAVVVHYALRPLYRLPSQEGRINCEPKGVNKNLKALKFISTPYWDAELKNLPPLWSSDFRSMISAKFSWDNHWEFRIIFKPLCNAKFTILINIKKQAITSWMMIDDWLYLTKIRFTDDLHRLEILMLCRRVWKISETKFSLQNNVEINHPAISA